MKSCLKKINNNIRILIMMLNIWSGHFGGMGAVLRVVDSGNIDPGLIYNKNSMNSIYVCGKEG